MSESTRHRTISSNDFFAGLDAEEIDFLTEHCVERQFAAGQVLFHQGDSAKSFFLIRDGHVALEIPAIEGPSLELQDLGPGRIVGWSWLIPPGRWTFQARAGTAVDLLEFDGEAILARCEADPRFGYNLSKRFSELMSERLRFSRKKMMDEWKPLGFA